MKYYASFLFIHCFKEDFCAKGYIFGTEEVLIINVFPDSRTNRIRKTGCFHPGRILGPRGAQRHLKLEGRSSQSPNSPLTLLLFIKDFWVLVKDVNDLCFRAPKVNNAIAYSVNFPPIFSPCISGWLLCEHYRYVEEWFKRGLLY